MRKNRRRYLFPDGNDYPVVESTSSGMLLMVDKIDVYRATPKNPNECALAQCAVRMGAKQAFIAGSVAYVVMQRDGEDVAVKFSIPARTQRAIKRFDETGEMPTEGFELTKLHPAATARAKKAANAKRSVDKRKWTGKNGGAGRDLRTYRYLTGHVHTSSDG